MTHCPSLKSEEKVSAKKHPQLRFTGHCREENCRPCVIVIYPQVLNNIMATGRPGSVYPMISSETTLGKVNIETEIPAEFGRLWNLL